MAKAKSAKKKEGLYVDGFVFVVPKKNVAAYKRMAEIGKTVWMKHGALDYKECMGDDVEPKAMEGMKHLTFPRMTKTKQGESVWFSFIVYKSKKHRDEVNTKVMKDQLMNDPKWQNKPMPFDMRKMAFAGFKVVVGA